MSLIVELFFCFIRSAFMLVSTFLLFIDLTNLFSFLFSLKKTDIIYVT